MPRFARLVLFVTSVVLAVSLLSTADPGAAQARRGGILRHAHISEPPTLDLHWTTAAVPQDIGVHIYEGLFALNAAYEPRPLLLESWKLSANRLVYTFRLRQGVLFHHGRELVADDVVTSLARWGRLAARGRELFRDTVSLTATDRYSVELRLREPNALVPLILSWPTQGAVIYPKEVVDEAGTGMVRRFIGTGPYRFVEHIPDRHIRLDRFDQYKPVDEAPSGMAGRREAYLDTIFFLPIPDPAVRVAGTIRGEYQFADTIPPDEYDRLRATRGIATSVIPVANWHGFVFNHREGLMKDKRLRHAFLAALDTEALMRGVYGPRQFWRTGPSLMPKEHPMWTDAGREFYNQRNPEKARQLLAGAGYQGQPVRWLVAGDLAPHIDSATIAKSQLERAGFVIDLQTSDLATVVSRRARPELWDVFTTRFTFVPDPVLLTFLQPGWPGWYENREVTGLLSLLRRHVDPKVRRELWQRAQRMLYEDAATVRLGDYFLLHVLRDEVKGYTGVPGTFYWNVWLERR